MRSKGTSRLTTVKRKANVGDLIQIEKTVWARGQYEVGDIAAVTSTCEVFPETIVYVDKWERPVHIGEYVVLEEVDPTNERLTSAEAKIAELVTEVATLKQAITPDITVKVDASDISRIFSMDVAKTPNQRRSDVIKRAQAFVADLEERAESRNSNRDGNYVFNGLTTRLTFHVNPDKGVVTALAHTKFGGKLHDKAFAKCHEDDVFNADIGKAIAAGKLYGVDIPQEFVDAPKPTEPVVGMRIRRKYFRSEGTYEATIKAFEGRQIRYTSGGFDMTKAVNEDSEIIDDTDAVYV